MLAIWAPVQLLGPRPALQQMLLLVEERIMVTGSKRASKLDHRDPQFLQISEERELCWSWTTS